MKLSLSHDYIPLKDHERLINTKFTAKIDDFDLKLRQAESDRDAQMEEVYRVRRLMREEKEQKEEVAYRFDKEKRAREGLEMEMEEKKEQIRVQEQYIRNLE